MCFKTIIGDDGDDHENGCLLGRETVQFGTQQTTGFIFKKKKSLLMLKQGFKDTQDMIFKDFTAVMITVQASGAPVTRLSENLLTEVFLF